MNKNNLLFILFLISLQLLTCSEQNDQYTPEPREPSYSPVQLVDTRQRIPNISCSINSPSLFSNPKFAQAERLLAQPFRPIIAQQTLLLIDPFVKTKDNHALHQSVLDVNQQFIMHMLINKLLQHCDRIIMNPQHELTVAKPFQQWRNLTNYCQKTNMPLITEMIQKCSPCTTESIILKPFCSFYDDIEKLRFLKNYCLLNKALRNRFKVPTTFNYYDYVTSATFDDIFQSSKYKKSQREESSTPKGIIPINLWLRDIILCLACDAENIQYKTPKKQ